MAFVKSLGFRPLTWSSLSHGRNDFTNIFDPDAFQRPTGSNIVAKSLRPLTWSALSHGRNDFTKIFDPDAFKRPTGSNIFVKSLGPFMKSFGAWPL